MSFYLCSITTYYLLAQCMYPTWGVSRQHREDVSMYPMYPLLGANSPLLQPELLDAAPHFMLESCRIPRSMQFQRQTKDAVARRVVRRLKFFMPMATSSLASVTHLPCPPLRSTDPLICHHLPLYLPLKLWPLLRSSETPLICCKRGILSRLDGEWHIRRCVCVS